MYVPHKQKHRSRLGRTTRTGCQKTAWNEDEALGFKSFFSFFFSETGTSNRFQYQRRRKKAIMDFFFHPPNPLPLPVRKWGRKATPIGVPFFCFRSLPLSLSPVVLLYVEIVCNFHFLAFPWLPIRMFWKRCFVSLFQRIKKSRNRRSEPVVY